MTHAEETEGMPSASDGEMWYNCAVCIARQREAPPEIPSVEAQQGSEIAEALASDDFTGLDEDGKTIAEKLKTQREQALDAWQKQFDEPSPMLVNEERCWIREPDHKKHAHIKVCSAKPDFAAIGRHAALVIDEKTGFLPVTPAYRNIQARIQAVAVFNEYPRVANVRAIISSYRFRGRVDPVDYNVFGLGEARRELMFNLWRTQQPHAAAVPGPWCRYCRAKTLCPEHASYAMLPMVHTGSTPLKKQDAIAVAYKLDLPQLAFIRLRKTMLTNFMAAVDDRLDQCSDEELASVGLRRQGTGSLPACDDVNKLWGVLYQAGMTVDEWQSCLQPQIGKIQDILVEKITKATGCTKDDAKANAKKLMAPAIKQQPKQPTLKAIKGEKETPNE